MLDIIFIWTLYRTRLTTLEKLALCYYVVICCRSNILYLSSASLSYSVLDVDGSGTCGRPVAAKVYKEPGVVGGSARLWRLISKGVVLKTPVTAEDGSATGGIWRQPIQFPRLNCCAGRSSCALASWLASRALLFSSFVFDDSKSVDSLRYFLQKVNQRNVDNK